MGLQIQGVMVPEGVLDLGIKPGTFQLKDEHPNDHAHHTIWIIH